MGAFSKEQTHVEICQPEESPRLGGAEAPPFDKGGFVAAPQRLPCQRELAPEATEGFTVGAFSKEQTHVEICQPEESPRLGGAEAPPFDKGGFGLRLGFHPVTIPGKFQGIGNR